MNYLCVPGLFCKPLDIYTYPKDRNKKVIKMNLCSVHKTLRIAGAMTKRERGQLVYHTCGKASLAGCCSTHIHIIYTYTNAKNVKYTHYSYSSEAFCILRPKTTGCQRNIKFKMIPRTSISVITKFTQSNINHV